MNIVLISPVQADLRPPPASWWCDGVAGAASPIEHKGRIGGETPVGSSQRRRESDHELTGGDQSWAPCRARQASLAKWRMGGTADARCWRENRCCTCSSRRSRFSQRPASRIGTGAFLFLKFSFASLPEIDWSEGARDVTTRLVSQTGRPASTTFHAPSQRQRESLPSGAQFTFHHLGAEKELRRSLELKNEMGGSCLQQGLPRPKGPKLPFFHIFRPQRPPSSPSPRHGSPETSIALSVCRLPTPTNFRCYSVVSDTPPDKSAAGETDIGRILLWAYYAVSSPLPRHPGASAQRWQCQHHSEPIDTLPSNQRDARTTVPDPALLSAVFPEQRPSHPLDCPPGGDSSRARRRCRSKATRYTLRLHHGGHGPSRQICSRSPILRMRQEYPSHAPPPKIQEPGNNQSPLRATSRFPLLIISPLPNSAPLGRRSQVRRAERGCEFWQGHQISTIITHNLVQVPAQQLASSLSGLAGDSQVCNLTQEGSMDPTPRLRPHRALVKHKPRHLSNQQGDHGSLHPMLRSQRWCWPLDLARRPLMIGAVPASAGEDPSYLPPDLHRDFVCQTSNRGERRGGLEQGT
jgi:hypothetical protein